MLYCCTTGLCVMVVDLQGMGVQRTIVELKSAQLPMLALVIRSGDMQRLTAELSARLAATPDFFNDELVLIDLQHIQHSDEQLDFVALVRLLREYRTQPLAVRAGSEDQLAAAQEAGLLVTLDGEVQHSLVREVRVEVPVQVQVPVPVPVVAPAVPAANTLIIDKPLRSGQRVYAKGGDAVVLAMVSFGAEVIADGCVHVYAPLRGRAVAGASGNTQARVFSTCMQPQLISIAGVYRALESGLPKEIDGKPAQARLDGEKLLIEPLA